MTFYKWTILKRRRVKEVNLQISCMIRQGEVRQSEETSERAKIIHAEYCYVPVTLNWLKLWLIFICHKQGGISTNCTSKQSLALYGHLLLFLYLSRQIICCKNNKEAFLYYTIEELGTKSLQKMIKTALTFPLKFGNFCGIILPIYEENAVHISFIGQ